MRKKKEKEPKKREEKRSPRLEPGAHGNAIKCTDAYTPSNRSNSTNFSLKTHESANAWLDVAYCATLPGLLIISIARKGVTVRFRTQVPYLKLLPTPWVASVSTSYFPTACI